MTLSSSERWEARYSADEYVYGTSPNDFLREAVWGRPPCDVLCLADGEGRNGVWLAEQGHRVTSVDVTEAGMAKAAALAAERDVALQTIVADLAEFDLGEKKWDLIVSIFAHTTPSTRQRVHRSISRALRREGLFVLEAYTPDQIGRGTGGPPVPELTMDLDRLGPELHGLSMLHAVETVRPVHEGPGHTGDGAVVQVVALPI